MQEEWDLGVKAACLAYNTTVHSSTGQTPFFETFGREATVPVHWIYPTLKPDREMELSDWTETIQERFQQAYSGMREQQQILKLEIGSGYSTLELFWGAATNSDLTGQVHTRLSEKSLLPWPK